MSQKNQESYKKNYAKEIDFLNVFLLKFEMLYTIFQVKIIFIFSGVFEDMVRSSWIYVAAAKTLSHKNGK